MSHYTKHLNKPIINAICEWFWLYCGRMEEHIIHNQLTLNDFTVWTLSCNLTVEQPFIDFKGRVISVTAGWLQRLMPSGCNRAKDLHPFSQRGGSNPWNEFLSKFGWNESIQTLQVLGSEWHTAENTSPDTNLSGSSSCHRWAAHSLRAITVFCYRCLRPELIMESQSSTVNPPCVFDL